MVVQFSDAVEKAIEQAIERMRAHARAIGELCMSWASLEHAVDRLLEPLIDCDRGTAATIASATDRLAARIEIIRRLLVHRELNGPWRDWIEEIFKRITNEVAPARNRYVHDQWRIQEELIMKIDKRANIARIQSHHPDQLIFDTSDVTPTDVVDRLTDYIDTILFVLNIARLDLEDWRTTGQLPLLRHQFIQAIKPKSRMDRFPIVLVWDGETDLPFSYIIDP